MTETAGARPNHILPGILAELADPANSVLPDDRIRGHLGRCRHCMAIYAEFGRAHVEHALALEANLPPRDLLEFGKGIASRSAPRRAALSFRRRFRLAAAAAAVVAGAGLVGWQAGWFERRPAVGADLRRTIAASLCEDSYNGLLYDSTLIPRARGTRGPEATTDFAPLIQAFTVDESSADVAFWLVAGLLAEGRWRDADPYLRESLRRFPADAKIRNLAAILAYKKSDLVGTERELREALRIERSPAHLANLARVLQEQGRLADAVPLWEEVSRLPDAAKAAPAAQNHSRVSRERP